MANVELKINDVTFWKLIYTDNSVLMPIALFTSPISTLHNQYMRALSCSYFFGVLARGLVMDYITRFSQPVDIGVAQTD